jgi:putative glutathione S-transferase
MGMLVEGKWRAGPLITESDGGRFKRTKSTMRSWITPDGTAGPTGKAGYRAEPGRYHLYVSYACPWAHRTLIFRRLKSLDEIISLSVVHWHMGENGWSFTEGPGVIADPVLSADYLHHLYSAAEPTYTGKVTVPVLWDRQTDTIVSNESADIIRMMNSAFDGIGAAKGDYYPELSRDEIDRMNERVYETVNNGVYKAGFARTQEAYEEAVAPLFETLAWLEERLSQRQYLMGDTITEADWRLFTTLLRFDSVYYSHFKCNVRRLIDYPNLWPYTRDLYQQDGVAETVRMDHIKGHYYTSQPQVDPTGIVPVGPQIDFAAPQTRQSMAV